MENTPGASSSAPVGSAVQREMEEMQGELDTMTAKVRQLRSKVATLEGEKDALAKDLEAARTQAPDPAIQQQLEHEKALKLQVYEALKATNAGSDSFAEEGLSDRVLM